MINLSGIQSLAERFMATPVTIRRRTASAQDPSNRSGDHDITYETETETVNGWFVDAGATSFSGGRMVAVIDRPLVRLPIDTVVDSGDKVTIGGKEFTVVDATDNETYAIWKKVTLVREE
jgi:hypothetical protein